MWREGVAVGKWMSCYGIVGDTWSSGELIWHRHWNDLLESLGTDRQILIRMGKIPEELQLTVSN